MSQRVRLELASIAVILAAIATTAAYNGKRSYASGAPLAGLSGYSLSKTINLGGEGGWDYITFDSETRRLYISRATKVVVLEVDSEKVVGEIPDTQGVHGIALAMDLEKGFVSDGRANDVTIFDMKTLKTLGTVAAGTNPDAIVYDAATKRVFTMNGRSKDSTAIDAVAGKVLGTIALPGKPEFAVSGGRGGIFVNIEDKSEMVRIDAEKLTVTNTWPLAPCESPSGLAMDRVNQRLFSGCDNKLMTIMNADSGKVIASLPIGEGVDATAFDPGNGYAFSSNGQSATLTVVHEDSPSKFTVVDDVPTRKGARTMALDRETHQVFLVTADFGPPPAATVDNPHPRPAILPGSFVVLVYAKKQKQSDE
jgi:DNA-binding beta-propeller fold protein YncE